MLDATPLSVRSGENSGGRHAESDAKSLDYDCSDDDHEAAPHDGDMQ